ncbi:hypothetical protein SAY86_028161 [Trapa natans]|uniref:Uncharacterized protein n=1 Tax=Trapa natans TaxID=22666 RepID=A0AAN7MF32_TRANT|nr:hypothetical protein SAY86_028161 [Trapa natans]
MVGGHRKMGWRAEVRDGGDDGRVRREEIAQPHPKYQYDGADDNAGPFTTAADSLATFGVLHSELVAHWNAAPRSIRTIPETYRRHYRVGSRVDDVHLAAALSPSMKFIS